ncbi:MAG: DNA replication/repair protein RecF [Solirubrobacteraceae bacterium]
MSGEVQAIEFREPGGPAPISPRIREVNVRDFRSYERACLTLGDGLTVISGPNGAGKTNLLEAVYFGCTGRSYRASNEREVVRLGASATRVRVDIEAADGDHQLAVGFAPGQPKRLSVDGASVETMLDCAVRPLLTVFLPDRLDLVKGPPAVRRSHLDQLVAALWPARVQTRRAYAQALAQRNALIARIRGYGGSREQLAAWDLQLARHGIALMADRGSAVNAVSQLFAGFAEELGVGAPAAIAYRPRSRAESAEGLADELAARTQSDLERGFTGHGPHRDELSLLRNGRELRTYGSQGQQRLALLALLLSERDAIGSHRGSLPAMLLDDVMSELDYDRRLALSTRLRESAGQAVVTSADLSQVAGADSSEVAAVAVSPGGTLGPAFHQEAG